jgi:hypothetical protein
VGMEVAMLLLQRFRIPGSVAWRTKEIGSKIVVHPMNFGAFRGEKGDCLAADQSTWAGY